MLSKIKINRVFLIEESPTVNTGRYPEKLKVLIFFSPEKDNYEDEDIEAIDKLLKELYANYGDKINDKKEVEEVGNFEYRFLYPPKKSENRDVQTTYSYFSNVINAYKPNIIHFIGEAQLEGDDELLNFWNMQGQEDVTDSIRLSDRFYPDVEEFIRKNAATALFIFQSWNNSTDKAYKAFKKIADELISRGLPAVLSIPSGLNINANSFTEYLQALKMFYEMLAEGCTLSNAFFELRRNLIRDGKGSIVYLKDIDSDSFRIAAEPAPPYNNAYEKGKYENNTSKQFDNAPEPGFKNSNKSFVDEMERAALKTSDVTGAKKMDESSFDSAREEHSKQKFNLLTRKIEKPGNND